MHARKILSLTLTSSLAAVVADISHVIDIYSREGEKIQYRNYHTNFTFDNAFYQLFPCIKCELIRKIFKLFEALLSVCKVWTFLQIKVL